MTAGLEGTAAYLDDIVITGRTIDEHNSRVAEVFRRIHDYGLRVRLDKCSFLETEIKYLGFIISAEGRRPDPAKIEAIQKMPAPRDISQLRAFLGLVNFYGTFVKELHSLRAPLDALTRKDTVCTWTSAAKLHSTKSRPNYTLLITESELYRRTALRTDPNIYHASRALTITQRGCSQIEKEALALVFAVQKFHRFVHGRPFTLRADHKPLLSTFGSKKGVPVYSANRLQRWATTLSNYNFNIEYVNTKDFGQAGALSCLISSQSDAEDCVIALVDAELSAEVVYTCSHLPVSCKTIRNATAADRLLKQVTDCALSGTWPKIDSRSPLWPFFNRRDTLTTVNGCLLIASRIVIPKALQRRVLFSLRKAHPGQTRMKMLARSFVYWSTLDNDIEKLIKSCASCAKAAKDPLKAELYSWPKSTAPWTRVHADFAGPLDAVHYLIIVDAYSKWPEIIQMNSISTSATISAMKKVFSQFGNPATLVTDSGTQFTSSLFKDFCTKRGLEHIRSPPFHPQSNDQAERFVDTFKRALIKLKDEERTTEDAIQTFLMAYRSTPCPSGPNHLSPSENFLGHRIRTELDLLMPTKDDAGPRDARIEQQFKHQHGARPRKFQVEDDVYVKDYRNAKSTWTAGIIIRRLGNTTYSVRVGDLTWIRHANQIRPRSPTATLNKLLDVFDMPLFTAASDNCNPPSSSTTQPTPTPPRRSTRTRRAPPRLDIDPSKKRYDSNF